MALRTLLAPLARTAALALRHSAPATTRLQQVRLASSNKNKWVAPDNLRKWAFNMSGFNQYGLYYNDCFNEEHDDDVKEALRRLPPELLVGFVSKDIHQTITVPIYISGVSPCCRTSAPSASSAPCTCP